MKSYRPRQRYGHAGLRSSEPEQARPLTRSLVQLHRRFMARLHMHPPPLRKRRAAANETRSGVRSRDRPDSGVTACPYLEMQIEALSTGPGKRLHPCRRNPSPSTSAVSLMMTNAPGSAALTKALSFSTSPCVTTTISTVRSSCV
jgi:hypothetical protein